MCLGKAEMYVEFQIGKEQLFHSDPVSGRVLKCTEEKGL